MNHTYETCIEACLACAAACDYCASACLKEMKVEEMAKCIQLDMECAALCGASSQLMCLAANMPMLFVNSVQTFARPADKNVINTR